MSAIGHLRTLEIIRASDDRIQSADASKASVQVAQVLHHFARDHYHLLLVGLYKIKEVGRGVIAAQDTKNETVLFNLARALLEHTALAYQVALIEKAVLDIPKRPDLKNLKATISRHHEMAKELYYNEKAIIRVNDMIKALSKHYDSAKRDYDDLCEFVHPNYGSNKLVSGGKLGTGQIRSHGVEFEPELGKAREIVEHCAQLADDDLNKTVSYFLMRLASWTDIACQPGAKLAQVFSVRSATSGDGKTKETAIYFKNARTHQEALDAFYKYLEAFCLQYRSTDPATSLRIVRPSDYRPGQ
jgi:hypothetical protein